MKIPRNSEALIGAVVSCLVSASAFATTYNVATIADLNAAIAVAAPGDTIIVQNGVYTTSSAISVNRVGTAANPILIEAQTTLGVEIKGTSGFSFSSPAAYVTIQGFKFTHASAISIPHGTSHIRFTRNLVQLTIPSGTTTSYFGISGDDVQIDRNELCNKSTLGEMLDISGSGTQVAQRLWVHHNYFHDFSSPGGNGAETIRWGLSGLSLSTGAGICEYNLFVRCTGENELISNKSSGNTYRYNTFLDSPGAQMSQRHGNDCFYYGNYFRNTDGLRVYGDRHLIIANYFEGNTTGVDMGNGDGEVETGAALTSHDKPDDCVVAENTFINNSTHYEMTGRTGGLGASNIVVADNIFQGGGSIASISGTALYIGTWTNNFIWSVGSTGNMPSSGYLVVNPLLATDANGVFHIQAGSPAIDATVLTNFTYQNHTFIASNWFDMDGQPRDYRPDVGADEYSGAPVTAHLLTTNDVGILSLDVPFVLGAAPALQTIITGSTTNYSVSLSTAPTFADTVTFSVSNLPPDSTAVFTPPTLTSSGTTSVSIATSNTTLAGFYTMAIVGVSTSFTNTFPVALSINDLLLNVSPSSVIVSAGGSTNYNVVVTATNSFSDTVTFAVSGLPSGATANFVPPSITGPGSAVLNITTQSNTPPATYTLTNTATSGGGTVSTSLVTLVVQTLGGTLFWNASATPANTNWSTAINWTNLTIGGFGPAGASNDVLFGNVGVVANNTITNNIEDKDLSIDSLVYTNTAGFQNTLIADGHTLLITGTAPGYQGPPSLNVGMETYAGSSDQVRATIFGPNGTLSINNTGAVVQVRQGFGSGIVGTLATLDMSGLGNFQADIRKIALGVESGTPRRTAGIWYLARTNAITLEQILDVNATNLTSGNPAITIGHNTQAANTKGSALYLGINNSLFVNQVVIGRGNQTNNVFAFNPAFLGSSPTLFMRGSDGSSRVGQWTTGDNSAGSLTGPSSGTNDFTGGTVDIMVDRFFLGRGRSTANTANTGFGTLTFNSGTIDANTVRLGGMVDEFNSTNSSGVGVANVNGTGILLVNTLLEFCHTNTTAAPSVAALPVQRGTLNVNGGTVQANKITAGTAAATINLSSATFGITTTAGTPAIPLGTFNITNSGLHLNVDAHVNATNLVVTTLSAGSVSTITIDSLANITGTLTFPLVSYNTFNGTTAGNFALSPLPPGYSGSLVDNTAQKRIDLSVTRLPVTFNQISLSTDGLTLTLGGINGLAGSPFSILGSTNVTLPLSNWMPVTTGVLDDSGTFIWSNAIDPTVLQQFYRVQTQ